MHQDQFKTITEIHDLGQSHVKSTEYSYQVTGHFHWRMAEILFRSIHSLLLILFHAISSVLIYS